MDECPPGVVGEIVIRGEQVLKGYFRNEEGTTQGVRRRLVPHRRHGPPRRGGLLLHRRPDEGHDHHRRRERVQPRGRGGALHAPGGVGGRGRSACPTRSGARTSPPSSCCAPGTTATEAEIIATARDRLAGFKKPKRVIFLDELPEDRQRQDHQARAARPLRRASRCLRWQRHRLVAPFRLDGKVGVVTGASYGLGVLFAEILASAGADVVVTARSVDKLDDTQAAGRGASAGAAWRSPATSPPTTTASAVVDSAMADVRPHRRAREQRRLGRRPARPHRALRAGDVRQDGQHRPGRAVLHDPRPARPTCCAAAAAASSTSRRSSATPARRTAPPATSRPRAG